jgi:sugar phosphate isomerase/epimerase
VQFIMFTKMLGEYPVPKVAEIVAGLGFSGVDLTVRPGGHVLPENVERDLPSAVKAFQEAGLSVPMITTSITNAAEPHAEAVFATAAECGIKKLKLGYWTYTTFGALRTLIEEMRKQLTGLAALGSKYGVLPAVHTHSGDYLSANPATLYDVLRSFDPQEMGAYIDPGHMAAEGGISCWRQGIDLLQEYISMVAVKSFGWFKSVDENTGEASWHAKLVPLKDGIVPWREVFQLLKRIGFDGPVSVHSEYKGSHSWRDLSTEELIEQTRQDLAYLLSVAG